MTMVLLVAEQTKNMIQINTVIEEILFKCPKTVAVHFFQLLMLKIVKAQISTYPLFGGSY